MQVSENSTQRTFAPNLATNRVVLSKVLSSNNVLKPAKRNGIVALCGGGGTVVGGSERE